MTNELLNENQRRALSTRLAMLDRFFYDIEELLSRDCLRGEMFLVINDLTEGQKQEVLSLIEEGRRAICLSRDRFNLTIKREYVHRLLAGHLSIFWTILEDSRASKLKGFGEVSPDLAANLDPTIENLIRIVNLLKSLVIEH